ncbi:VIT1/CCC1 transporter family protein [bacterium]
MKHSLKVGFSFGVTSGIITTLGLMVGLHSTTKSKLVVLGGILTIAIADAFSDALGIHISEEAENIHTKKQIWTATISTFIFKAIFSLSFIIPILLFELALAIKIGIIWGLLILTLLSYKIAKSQKNNPLHVIIEHLIIAFLVILTTHFVGDFVGKYFS